MKKEIKEEFQNPVQTGQPKKKKSLSTGTIIGIILLVCFLVNIGLTIWGAITIENNDKHQNIIIAMLILMWILPVPFYPIWVILLIVYCAKSSAKTG